MLDLTPRTDRASALSTDVWYWCGAANALQGPGGGWLAMLCKKRHAGGQG
jgi:hypothetical protein